MGGKPCNMLAAARNSAQLQSVAARHHARLLSKKPVSFTGPGGRTMNTTHDERDQPAKTRTAGYMDAEGGGVKQGSASSSSSFTRALAISGGLIVLGGTYL